MPSTEQKQRVGLSARSQRVRLKKSTWRLYQLHQEARSIAKAERASVDEVVASALACHLAASRLRERASRGNRDNFLAMIEKIKDIEPEEYDRLYRQGRLPLVRHFKL
jgi:hypothetical protein